MYCRNRSHGYRVVLPAWRGTSFAARGGRCRVLPGMTSRSLDLRRAALDFHNLSVNLCLKSVEVWLKMEHNFCSR